MRAWSDIFDAWACPHDMWRDMNDVAGRSGLAANGRLPFAPGIVSVWRVRGHVPFKHWDVLIGALAQRGLTLSLAELRALKKSPSGRKVGNL